MERYAQATIARQKAIDALRNALNAVESSWAQWQQRVAMGCSAGDLSRDRQHCQELELHQKACEKALKGAEDVVDAAWKAWVAARQQRETVDRVRDLQKEEYDKLLQQEEQKLLDEMAGRKTGNFHQGAGENDARWN